MQSWQRAQRILRQEIGEEHYDAWIKPLRLARLEDGQAVIHVPSKFYRDWVRRHYLGLLRTSLKDGDGPAPEIIFEIDRGKQHELFPEPPSLPTAAAKAKPRRRRGRPGGLIERYTFDSFVVGPSNQFAHAGAQAVAAQPGELYNPLFIYGPVGIGKTHLVNAIGHRVLERNPQAKIVYISSEAFVNDLITSLRQNKMAEFKTRFRKVDLLILDDAQFLAGRERTQEEFFHTFNTLHESHRQIVLTSDKYPKEIPDLEERLRNRFEWGLTADIQAPEIETRVAIIQAKAEQAGLKLPNEVRDVVAQLVGANVREIEGALTRLGAMASLNGREIDVEFAREVLTPHARVSASPITMDHVKKVVAEHFGLSVTELCSKRRTQHIAQARQVAMHLAREVIGASYPSIGSEFGGRDHSTVIHACKKIIQQRNENPGFTTTLRSLEEAVRQKRT
ncbi:MAG: chromosomal replication initiator protein DnaA [Deltaproteobacteria bacterium]